MGATPAAASPAGWNSASNISRNLTFGMSFVVPAGHGDWDGVGQAALSIGAAGAITQALKWAIPETRPDGSNRMSFPSGHTSMSFAAAASLQQRYGWKAGAPATLLAAFTGLARVKADKHYVHDVVVGAVIGEAGGLLLTHHRRTGAAPPAMVGMSLRF
ncbi:MULTISPECIES: phosphatase PAP2 family protein [Sphingomonas]|uniref:phosphatase PAP2 family protein n=1 Tax=Sphingomonas TaxID=13687 RepID=UPI0013B3BD81|nr:MULTISPECIES: phosphatase PAP2 family protein [Sphingomonas]